MESNNYDARVQQAFSDSCAIKAQQLILESRGIHVPEWQLREDALMAGIYREGFGTPMINVGDILKEYGRDVHKYVNASTYDILCELYQGHQVIVGVDSGELWAAGMDEIEEDLFQGEKADHALLVSGFIVDPFSAEQNILLTDPGTGGVCVEYSLEQFEDAWADSDFFMVTSN